MSDKAPDKRIVMAREVARKWLEKRATSEYRFTAYSTGRVKRLPSLLRAFRDGKVALKDVQAIKDLGIRTNFDNIELWSSNYVALLSLLKWLEARGFETTGMMW